MVGPSKKNKRFSRSEKMIFTNDEKMEILNHLNQNVPLYYGRLTVGLTLRKQTQAWDNLAMQFPRSNLRNGAHLKEIVRQWTKRVLESYQKNKKSLASATGSKSVFSAYDKACIGLIASIRGKDYVFGISGAEESSGTTERVDMIVEEEEFLQSSTDSNMSNHNNSTNIIIFDGSSSRQQEIASTSFTPFDSSLEENNHVIDLENLDKPENQNNAGIQHATIKNKNSSNEKIMKNEMLKSFCSSQEKEAKLKEEDLKFQKERFILEKKEKEVYIKKQETEIKKIKVDSYVSLLRAITLERELNLSSEDILKYRKQANFSIEEKDEMEQNYLETEIEQELFDQVISYDEEYAGED